MGLYMSIKDCLKFKGTVFTNGFYINVYKNCDKNVRTVKHLIDQGVIFMSKGNVPQGVFSMECYSMIFGEGKNPYDFKRTSGGSSGGDAALVRLGFANSALGSDIAWLLRIPALFNGIVTLKPTVPRIRLDLFSEFFEFQDDAHLYPNFQTYLFPTVGSLTRKVEDCETLMEVMVWDVTHDMFSPPLPCKRVNELPKKMGYLKELDLCEVSPANKRTILEAKQILEDQGVEFVELDLDKEMRELYVLALVIFWQVPTLNKLAPGKIKIQQPSVRDFKEMSFLLKTPKFFYPLIKKGLKYFGQNILALSVVSADLSKSMNNSYLTNKKFKLCERIIQKIKDHYVECFLSYGLTMTALIHGVFNEVFIQSLQTFMFIF